MNGTSVANLYNPHEQTKEQLIESFVVRGDIFDELYQEIKSTGMAQSTQHYLIEGQRGMGKTTLLLRLSYEIEDDPQLQPWLIPLVLKEEAYYGIRRLYALWETLARELELKHEVFVRLAEQMSDAYDKEANYERFCFETLMEALASHDKRIILFIDNFGDLLYNFTGSEHYRLYQILRECPFLRIVSASAVSLESFTSAQEGFLYKLFEKKRLKSLSREETHALLLEIAKTYHKETVIQKIIEQQAGRIESLRVLTGGVIRTMVLLFEIFAEHEESNTLADLDTVLDRVTPLYKSRMDGLSPLQREVVNAIAFNWEAISSEEIARKTRLNIEEIVTVLNELEHVFLIEYVSSRGLRKFYRLQERFFNIWYLMRLSPGNGQTKVIWLLHFLESWYDKVELTRCAQKHITAVTTGKCLPKSAFYLTEAFVKTGLLDQDVEHQMILVTKRMLQDTDTRLAAKSSPSDKDIFNKGEFYYQQQQFERAIPYFLELKQKNEHIYFRLGYAYSQLAHYKEAIAYFLQAAKHDHVEAMLHLGMVYEYQLRDYSDAKKYYLMAVGKGHTDAMLKLGNLYYETLQDYYGAKKYYLMVVKEWQVRAKVLTSGSFSLSYLKNYLVTAIKGTVKDPELYQVDDFPGVKEDYLEVLQATACEAMFQLGSLYTKELKNSEKAERFFRMAAETGHVRAMIYLADLYNDTIQDYKKAEKYYHMAASKDNVYALVNLGFLYHNELQNYKKAEQCYLIAAERGEVSAMNGLAWLYFEQKRDKQNALYYAQKTLDLENNLHTAHTAACIYLWNNQQEEAFQLAEKFMYAPEAYKALEKDILFYLMLVLAKHHYYQVISYFRAFELRLQERFRPLYYALLYFIGNPNYHKLPPELSELVEDIIHQIKQMTVDYA